VIAAVTVVVVAAIVAVGIALAVNHAAKTIEKTGNLGGKSPAARYGVGQTGRSAGFAFTLLDVRDPFSPPGHFTAPAPGDHYVAVDVQVGNLMHSTQEFSSLDGFHLVDSVNHQFDQTIVPGVDPRAPNGQFAPQQAIRGFVVFEVPTGATGLKLRCQGTITSAGAVFRLP
jgi:hypothetical protein